MVSEALTQQPQAERTGAVMKTGACRGPSVRFIASPSVDAFVSRQVVDSILVTQRKLRTVNFGESEQEEESQKNTSAVSPRVVQLVAKFNYPTLGGRP